MALLDELEVVVGLITLELEDAGALDELELALLEVPSEDVVGFDAEIELVGTWLEVIEAIGLLEDENVVGFGMLLELVPTDIVDEDEMGLLLLLDLGSMLEVVPDRLEEAVDEVLVEDVGFGGLLDELEEIFANDELGDATLDEELDCLTELDEVVDR